MAYTPLQVSIPAPCHEDWNRMTPVGRNQRHCGSCAKNVTDFSWMTDREIHQFLAVAGNHLCGRFRADQLERPIRAFVKPATGWRSLAAAAGLLLSAGISAQAPSTSPDATPTVGFVSMTVSPKSSTETPEPTTGPLRGKVTDENGVPLIGASVRVLGTTSGTVTDLDGAFCLTATTGQRIQLSYVGYEPLEFSVLEDDPGFAPAGVEYVLFAGTEDLQEIEVVATAGHFMGFLTGGVSIITTENIPEPPVEIDPPYSVFPNPFTTRINVEFRGADVPIAIGTVSAQLFNVNGQLLRVWPARTHEAGELSLSFPTGDLELVPGPYILRLTDAAGGTQSLVVLYH